MVGRNLQHDLGSFMRYVRRGREVTMALSRIEKETVIIFNEEESTANVCVCNSTMRRRLAEYSSENTDCCLVNSHEEFDEYIIPKSWIKIHPPRQYSEEQRQKLAERARENLAKKKEQE